MRHRFTVFFLAALTSTSAIAHHSFVAFDESRQAFVRGVVTGYEFRNPHTYIFMDVTSEGGEVATWRIEGETRNDLYRNGWREESLQMGEAITVTINPPVDSSRRYGRLLSLEKTDGTVLAIPNEEDERGRDNIVPATSMDGVWLAIQEFRDFVPLVEAVANDKAREERLAYQASGALPPNTRCIDMSIPQRLGRAHVYEIKTVSEDLILIHGEDDAIPRSIYMDGRSHPENIRNEQRSYTGHSVGHWEGDTLVIDTTLFRAQDNGHGGYPSGLSKHLIERFTLNEDKTQIAIDFIVEDPEYLSDSISHTFEWQHSPHVVRLPHSCDTESALGYIVED